MFAVCTQYEDAESLSKLARRFCLDATLSRCAAWTIIFALTLGPRGYTQDEREGEDDTLKATTPSVGADIEWFDYQSRGKLGKLCCHVAGGLLKVLCAQQWALVVVSVRAATDPL